MASALQDAGASAHAATGYFVDQKKGEVNELKTLLKSVSADRDVKRKREVIKKVIAYMTLGIDVSRLFTDMVLAIETRDIVIKKMIYFYLCNYAHSEPEMAIMCINSLRRDCDNENPMVRGLALRSLCSLRLESILEYVEQPLAKGLRDISPYVRKTAVLGVLKIHYLAPQLVQNSGYENTLLQLLHSDPDASVVTNCLYALHELALARGGLQASAELVALLLGRVGEFSEWGLNTVLELVSRYRPASEEEVFSVMNLLDPVLRTANSGSVLAVLKCFFALTAPLQDSLYGSILERARAPLLTLITGANPEVQFMTLKHLECLLRLPGAPEIFQSEHRQLFVRYNEPPHVKHLKVALLPRITCLANVREVCAELQEYVTDVDSELCRRAIDAMAAILMRLGHLMNHASPPPAAPGAAPAAAYTAEELTGALVALLDMDSSYVKAAAAVALGDVVRVLPHLSDLILPSLAKHLRRAEAPEARGRLVWMLGEFGHNVLEAPYLLEQLVDAYEDEASVSFKLQLLTACIKLFVQRPPEMQRILGRLFKRALNDSSHQDLRDRALLYYRLLQTDVQALGDIVCAGPPCASLQGQQFAEDKDTAHAREVFQDFNSLAVVFDAPSTQFVQEKYRRVASAQEKEPLTFASPPSSSSAGHAEPPSSSSAQHFEAAPAPHPAAIVSSVN
eukprot:gene30760-37165_t